MIVGIAPSFDTQEDTLSLAASYVDAIAAAGGTPLILPPMTETRAIRRSLKQVDRFLLTGGRGLDKRRDTFERIAIRMGYRQRLPMLGICRGHQMLAEHLGGAIAALGHTRHDQKGDRSRPTHFIDIEPASRLQRSVGQQRIKVNSLHRFHVTQIPAGFRVTARSRDGVVEAMEHSASDRWIVGVQFHPERMRKTRPQLLKLLRAFVRGR